MAGWTALHMAANCQDVGGVRPTILFEFLELCADPHVALKGNNCLFKAAGTGHQEAVYVLLASGKFDAQALNDQGKSLADVAHRCHHELEMWLRDVWEVPCHAPPKLVPLRFNVVPQSCMLYFSRFFVISQLTTQHLVHITYTIIIIAIIKVVLFQLLLL